MKVNLIKEAEYNLNEDKCSKIPFDTFVKMSGIDTTLSKGNAYQKVRIFKDINEFKNAENVSLYDNTKDVYVLSDGQFLIFLKDKCDTCISTKTLDGKNYESTNTKNNTEKKS